ncbi:hypothetical protein Acor_79770 [Acrocarpospora corrugata]|uniref:Uncharacterized protein n=1 Tax=Acrocarpospora corrugata TaxID=35763 RepID=A0A5M3WHT9_9ACTN|nr:hypothetical protein [Acrocarpospora corrugata]GES05908.1 hypothetical protein Acor_79770 [Acrocarpospora corrugata]
MTGTPLRLAEVYPQLTATITALLGADPLAATVGDLPYLGRCTCTPTCAHLLTAPPGTPGPRVVQLERDGADVIWLSVSPSGTEIVGVEVLDEISHAPAG